MIDAYLDGLLDELVAAEPRERWSDVLRRARRSRRRYTAVATAVAALVLVPATWAAVDAFEGSPAPQGIQHTFIEGDAAAAALNEVNIDPATGFMWHVPTADPGKAHGVLQLATSDGPLDMWAAPTSSGDGTCWFVGWQSDIQSDGALGHGSCTGGDMTIDPETWSDANHPSYTILVGSVTGAETTLDVTLTDGSTTTLPVVEHLFLGALPHGSKVASIVGRDAAGNLVASWTPPPG
ncbi:MAG TPA: hypothetical protein VJP41_08770 [Gaiellaceae bacterium]|nr:hypothetical protein [Gaiellaceae bacterium]